MSQTQDRIKNKQSMRIQHDPELSECTEDEEDQEHSMAEIEDNRATFIVTSSENDKYLYKSRATVKLADLKDCNEEPDDNEDDEEFFDCLQTKN